MVSVMDCGIVSSQEEQQEQEQEQEQQQQEHSSATDNRSLPPNSAVSQNSIELQISDNNTKLDRCALKLNLENSIDEIEQVNTKSPLTSKIRQSSLAHQTTLTSQVDLVENRKTLRDALYQGIFHRHRRSIFALGSFLRMLKSRNSQYNTIRSSSEGEDVDEIR